MAEIIVSELLKNINWDTPWKVVENRVFTPAEVAQVKTAIIEESECGKKVTFYLKNGKTPSIPLSADVMAPIGEVIDITTARILTLVKGDDIIYRILP